MGRTVYCRWCHNRGHNRRTCPEYTKNLKEYAEVEVENNEERGEHETWRQEQYAKRIKADALLDGTAYDRPKQTNGSGTRRCSFCGKQGHNRRSCELFATEKSGYLKDAIKYRKDIVKTLQKSGLGIGSLVTSKPRYGRADEDRNYLFMVVSVEWEAITHRSGMDAYRAIKLQALDIDPDTGKTYRDEYVPFPKPYNHKDDPKVEDWNQKYSNSDKYWEHLEIVSKVDSKATLAAVPSNWYQSSLVEKSEYFKNYFKDARHSSYWDNYYD